MYTAVTESLAESLGSKFANQKVNSSPDSIIYVTFLKSDLPDRVCQRRCGRGALINAWMTER